MVINFTNGKSLTGVTKDFAQSLSYTKKEKKARHLHFIFVDIGKIVSGVILRNTYSTDSDVQPTCSIKKQAYRPVEKKRGHNEKDKIVFFDNDHNAFDAHLGICGIK